MRCDYRGIERALMPIWKTTAFVAKALEIQPGNAGFNLPHNNPAGFGARSGTIMCSMLPANTEPLRIIEATEVLPLGSFHSLFNQVEQTTSAE
jgi:hypothetical protein